MVVAKSLSGTCRIRPEKSAEERSAVFVVRSWNHERRVRMTKRQILLHRTMANLIYPAVLGTFIVNLINFLVQGHLLKHGWFPVIASAILVAYFVLDYWITVTEFEDYTDPEGAYRLSLFCVDLVLLVSLSVAICALWVLRDDVWFSGSVVVSVLCMFVWSAIVREEWCFTDSHAATMYCCTGTCVAVGILAYLAPATVLHQVVRYAALGVFGIVIVLYARHVLSERR